MKQAVKNVLIYSLALFLAQVLVDGISVEGGLVSYLLGGLALYLLFLILKPVLSVLSIPLNLVTLGLFSFVTNSIILYLMTVFVQTISVSAFTFKGYSLAGFIVPQTYVNTFFSYVVSAMAISIIVNSILWLIKK